MRLSEARTKGETAELRQFKTTLVVVSAAAVGNPIKSSSRKGVSPGGGSGTQVHGILGKVLGAPHSWAHFALLPLLPADLQAGYPRDSVESLTYIPRECISLPFPSITPPGFMGMRTFPRGARFYVKSTPEARCRLLEYFTFTESCARVCMRMYMCEYAYVHATCKYKTTFLHDLPAR